MTTFETPLVPQVDRGMDDDTIRAAIARARTLCDDQPEPFRSLAFQTLLKALLTRNDYSSGPSAPPAREAPSPVGMDLTEFLATKKADTHPDRVVAIAYYHYHTRDGAGVTTKDLADSYARARVRKPQNYPDVIAGAVRRGLLVEGDRRDGLKSWVITRTGEAHVEQKL